MTRIPWVCNGYAWPVNPYEDSGWVVERAYQEYQPIQRIGSVIFSVGIKSARRKISGYIIGPKAQEFYNKWSEWLLSQFPLTLKDHHNVSRSCILLNFSPSSVLDIQSFRQNRPCYRYTAEFITVDSGTIL